MRFTSDDIAAAVAGTPSGPPAIVSGAAIDSRAIGGGELFVPIVAERDGHDFIPAALRSGAAAYLTAQDPAEGTAIRVDDTAAALASLGGVARDRLPDAVIGITGSVGKTSVKDLLATTLSTTFATTASEKSFNNELGVPLTLLNAPDDTEVLVVEMGSRGVGHIRELCQIARPTAAIVTAVAEVHTSEFGSVAEVAKGKAELVEAVPSDGYAVLNADDYLVVAMADRTSARVVMYGERGDVRAADIRVDDQLRPTFDLLTPWGTAQVTLAVHGLHQVSNGLAAAAAALVQGVSLDEVATGLGAASLSPWRMQLERTRSGAIVINDAYNANPTSMSAALRSLAALDARRRVAVLGLMAELGDVSDVRHRELGELATELGIEVITVDCPAYGVGVDVADAESAIAALGELTEDDAVLVKASRSADLQRVADVLTGVI